MTTTKDLIAILRVSTEPKEGLCNEIADRLDALQARVKELETSKELLLQLNQSKNERIEELEKEKTCRQVAAR